MHGNSRSVTSNQTGVHEHLPDVVQRHLKTEFRKPFKPASVLAFREMEKIAQRWRGDIIIDSGCGKGESTRALAKMYPAAMIIGIDKSETRLAAADKISAQPANVLFVRAELGDFWRLAAQSEWRLSRHFILYPNPWPKKQHLKRRWHGHPAFPALLRLQGILQLRSNWRVYLEEFALAVELATGLRGQVKLLQVKVPVSPFERKYLASGQALYAYEIDLSG